eukprot:gene44378-55188_t
MPPAAGMRTPGLWAFGSAIHAAMAPGSQVEPACDVRQVGSSAGQLQRTGSRGKALWSAAGADHMAGSAVLQEHAAAQCKRGAACAACGRQRLRARLPRQPRGKGLRGFDHHVQRHLRVPNAAVLGDGAARG